MELHKKTHEVSVTVPLYLITPQQLVGILQYLRTEPQYLCDGNSLVYESTVHLSMYGMTHSSNLQHWHEEDGFTIQRPPNTTRK